MNNQINLQEETSVEKLKALAYEQVLAKSQAEQNLAMLQGRIAQLDQEAKDIVKK